MIAKLRYHTRNGVRSFALEESGGLLTLREVDIENGRGGTVDAPTVTASERVVLGGGTTITVEAP